jgi:hypothetical protein
VADDALAVRPDEHLQRARSLGDLPDRPTLLDGTGLRTVFGYRLAGMTLDQLAHVIGQKSKRRTTILRDLDLEGFRAELVRANDPARRYIVNFHRPPLFGWGGGHHSPLGGYLADRDQALVLDVNRKVGAFLVAAADLFATVDTIDPQSRSRRGLLRIE